MSSAIAAATVSRNIGIVTRRVAPESTSWWWTSPGVYVGLTVVIDAAGQRDGVEDDGVLREVGRHHGDDLALAEAPRRQAARERRTAPASSP